MPDARGGPGTPWTLRWIRPCSTTTPVVDPLDGAGVDAQGKLSTCCIMC